METDGPVTKRLNAKPKVVGTTDLIVRNLPYTLEEDGLRAYFETFGELSMVQLKKDLEGKSRGFGFIRYKNLEDQGRCFSERHYIEGRSVEVKLPQVFIQKKKCARDFVLICVIFSRKNYCRV